MHAITINELKGHEFEKPRRGSWEGLGEEGKRDKCCNYNLKSKK